MKVAYVWVSLAERLRQDEKAILLSSFVFPNKFPKFIAFHQQSLAFRHGISLSDSISIIFSSFSINNLSIKLSFLII